MGKGELDNITRIRLWRSSLQRFLHGSKGILKRHGITTRGYHSLLEIWAAQDGKGLSITELAGLIHLHHNSAVGVVDQLCKHGLAVRARVADDKRVVNVQLTDQGRMVLAALVDDHLLELNKVATDLRRVLAGD